MSAGRPSGRGPARRSSNSRPSHLAGGKTLETVHRYRNSGQLFGCLKLKLLRALSAQLFVVLFWEFERIVRMPYELLAA